MISFLFGRKKSANSAKERLQLVLIHDRTDLSPAQLELLKDDLIATISRHIDIDPTSVQNQYGAGRARAAPGGRHPLKDRHPPAGALARGTQQASSIMFRSNFWRHFDYWLLGAVIIALVFGVTMIRSAAAGNENLTGLTVRQIIFGGIGFVVIILAAAIDYRFWSGAIVPMYIVIVVFLLLLVIGGGPASVPRAGSRPGWYPSNQPSWRRSLSSWPWRISSTGTLKRSGTGAGC